MRTYGKFEPLYTESRKAGSVFLKFAPEAPPEVRREDGGGLTVTVHDLLTENAELAIPVDLVVLVTGMIPRANQDLVDVLKLPAGSDGFFNEIHPKLRPVETVVDGVFIAGACQGPKNSSESVASGLAAVTQSAVILKKGSRARPARRDRRSDRLHRLRRLPHGLLMTPSRWPPVTTPRSSARLAVGGCGGCVPICPENAIDLLGYTDAQVSAMIESLAAVPA
jgi:heterodisulfide reductase subunit A